MTDTFECPENKGTTLKVQKDDNQAMISILTPWVGRFRDEFIVCLSADELERFKAVVSEL